MLPPSQRVLYQSDDNAQLKQFLTRLETTIDLSQFAAMGGTALAGVASNKGAISGAVASGIRNASPTVKAIETSLKDFGKGISEFNKAGGFKKLYAPFEVAGKGIKVVTPEAVKGVLSVFKPFTNLLSKVVKQGTPLFEEFFKGLSSFTSNFYQTIKNKLSSVGTSPINSVNSLQKTQNALVVKETKIATNINNLNDKFKANAELNKTAPIKDFAKGQDQLKQNITNAVSELNANDKLLKQYDELIKSKNKLLDLDNQIKKLRLTNNKADEGLLKKLESQAKQEIKSQKQIVASLKTNLSPEQLDTLKNDKVIRNAERKVTTELATTKGQLQNINNQKTVINDNLGKGGTDTVNVKNYAADQRALKSLAQQEEELTKIIKQQEDTLKGLNKAREVGSKTVLQNTDEAVKLATELNKTTVAMQNLGKTFQNYVKATDALLTGTSIFKAFVTITEGIQDVTRAVKDAESALLIMQKQGFDTSGFDELSKVKDIITLNTQVATDFLTSTVAKFNEFEENLKKVGTVFETGLNLEERNKNLQEFGFTIQNLVNNNLKNTVTETEALAATYEALSAGFVTASSSTQVMEAGLKLAASSGADSGEVMRLLSKTLNAYGKDASEAGKVAGQLNGIVENGITTIGELSAGFGQLSTVASAVGIPLEETGAALAVLTTKGTSTAQAMTQLQSLFTAFIDPEMNKRLEKLKIDFKLSKAVVETKGLVNVLKELDSAIGGNAVKWGQLLPEIQSYRAALALTSDGVTKLEAVTQKMVNTTVKNLEEVFAIRLDGSQITQFSQIVNKLNSTLVNVGRSLAPLLTDSINFVEVVTKNLSKWTNANLGLIKTTTSLALGLKALQGVTGAFIGTSAKLLGIFMTWRFLTGKLLPDLGALFKVTGLGRAEMALTSNVFEKMGIALRRNALATNNNLTVMGKMRTVLGNLLGIGAKTGDQMRLMGEATGEAAKKFQGMSATEKLFRGVQNSFLSLKENWTNGLGKMGSGMTTFVERGIGGNLKLATSNIGNFLKGGWSKFTGALDKGQGVLNSIFYSPVIPTGVGLLAALGAAAYGVSKGFKIIEEQKETLKTALLDIKESIKDTTQTLNSLSFASVKLDNLSSTDIKKQLSEVSDLYTEQANTFLKTNEKNLARFDELQKQRDELLNNPIEYNSEDYENYKNELEKINNEIAELNNKLTSELGEDLSIRVLMTQNSLEKLLDSEQKYLKALETIDNKYKVGFSNLGESISTFFKGNLTLLESFGYGVENTLIGLQKWADNWFGGNLADKILLDKNFSTVEKLNNDLNTLQQQYAENLIGNYKYENLIIDGKKIEVDLQKELNNLWNEQGNIQDRNYSKFVKTIEAVREELNAQTKSIQKNIELASNLVQENKETLEKKYTLDSVLQAKQKDEYSQINNTEDKISYLKNNIVLKSEEIVNDKRDTLNILGYKPFDYTDDAKKVINKQLDRYTNVVNSPEYLALQTKDERKEYLGENVDFGVIQSPFQIQTNRRLVETLTDDKIVDVLRTSDLKELEKKVVDLNIDKKGKALYAENETVKQQLEQLKLIHESLKKANKDLELIAKAGNILNNRIDLTKPNSLAESKTKNFESRQSVINNTLSAVEKVSQGAIIDKNFREEILKDYEKELGKDKFNQLTQQEKDAYASSTFLTSNIKEYQQSLDQSYIDFLQDSSNQKKLVGLSDQQKYEEFFKGDVEKYKYKTNPQDIKVEAKSDLKTKGVDLKDEEVEALLDSDTLPDKIIEQADSVIQDLEGKFITAEEALKRFDENIMTALGDVGSESIPSLLNDRLNIIRKGNEDLIEIEESTAKKLETVMSGIFGESAKQVEALSSIRLKASKNRLETEKQIFQKMVQEGHHTKEQLEDFKRDISQMESDLLVEEVNYLKVKNNITVEEFEKRKQILDLQQSSEFTYNKERITQLEQIDKQLLENKITLEKNILNTLKTSGKLTESQIKEYQDKIIVLEEQFSIKVLEIKAKTFQKEFDDREIEINKQRAKVEFFSNQNLISEQSSQGQILSLQRQSLLEYGELLNKKLELTKQNNGDITSLLIDLQKNTFDLEQNTTEQIKVQLERRQELRDAYFSRLEKEQTRIKENLNSGIQIATPTIEFLEDRKGTSGSALEQLEIERQIITLKEKGSALDFQLKERNLTIDENLLKIVSAQKIEKEQITVDAAQLVVNQKETLVLEAKTNEQRTLANEQLQLALENKEKITHETKVNISRIQQEYQEEKNKLTLQRESLKVEIEVNKLTLESSKIQNKYNVYQEQLTLLQRFLALRAKGDISEKEKYALEKKNLEYRQTVERKLFELENKKLELQYRGLEIQGNITKEKLKQENIQRREEVRELDKRNQELKKKLNYLDSKENLTDQEFEQKRSISLELEKNSGLLESNLSIIEANDLLIETQKENNNLLSDLIKELKNTQTTFELKQKAERAEFMTQQNAPKVDKQQGFREAEQGVRETQNLLNNNQLNSTSNPSGLKLKQYPDGSIKNFKDGGQVTKSELIEDIKNTKDPYKVLELGNQVVKALEKEGKDGIPIVANKDEYILTKEETRVFKHLKQSGIWDSFSNGEIGNYAKGGVIKNKRGHDIPQSVYSQLLKAPEGTTTRLTDKGKPAYYIRTKDGINKVGLGDKYTPTNSAFPFTVVLNSKGFPVLFANDFVYEAGKKDRYIKNKYVKAKESYHETDYDFKYRTNVNWTNVKIPVYGYIKNGERSYKIIKEGKLLSFNPKHGDILSGQKFFINKSEKFNGYLGFHSPQQWAKLDKADREVTKINSNQFPLSILKDPKRNSKNPIADNNSQFVRGASQADIQDFNASRTPTLKGYTGYVASGKFALYRQNSTGQYFGLWGDREEDMFDPSYVREGNKVVKKENPNLKKLQPMKVAIKSGTKMGGTDKVFFEPKVKELENKRGFYNQETFDKLIQYEHYLLNRGGIGKATKPKATLSTIKIFKDGGKVNSSSDLDTLVSNAKENEAEVFNLGKEILKAIHREGIGAVPLVANKDEYVLNKADTQIFTKLKDNGIWEEIKDNINNYRLGGEIGLENNNKFVEPKFYKNKEGAINALPSYTKNQVVKKLEIEHNINVESQKTGERDMDTVLELIEKRVKIENDKLMKGLEFEFKNRI